MDTRAKILTSSQADERVRELLQSGGKLAAAWARFDPLTADHARAAGKLCAEADLLIILLASDQAAACVCDEATRAQLAAALEAVDLVLICDEAEAAEASERWALSLIDLEASVARDVAADVLRRHEDS